MTNRFKLPSTMASRACNRRISMRGEPSQEYHMTPFTFPPYINGEVPHFWKFERTGTLAAAIKAFLDDRCEASTISDEHVKLVVAYLVHWIEAPCWREVSNTLGKRS